MVNDVEEINKLVDKCTFNNLSTAGKKPNHNSIQLSTTVPTNFTDPTDSAFLPPLPAGRPGKEQPAGLPGGKVLPVLEVKRRVGYHSTPRGGRKKKSERNNSYDTNESKSDVVEYCVYGTLLATCLIILLLW